MTTSNGFQILTHQQQSCYWNASLARVFEECRRLAAYLQAEICSKRLAVCTCILGKVGALPSSSVSLEDLASLMSDYDLELQSPFEGIASISGGVWLASDIENPGADDALLKLRFEPLTRDLPFHSHDFSDRVIYVADGLGEFILRDGLDMKATKVSTGDILIFGRGLVHTFRTSDDPLVLLSYHSPFIELEDSRQFRLATSMD